MRVPVLVSCMMLVLSACDKKEVDPTPDTAAMTQLNVPYGGDPKLKMDLYLPAGRSEDSTRVIILIHGGGWADGDKADFTPYVTVLQQQFPDYAIFNINYRLAAPGVNLFPTQEGDVQFAIDYIYANRSTYKISGNFVFLGASAGAHLALLQGYKHTSTVKPTAIIDLFGPTDLTSLYNSSPLAAIALTQLLATTPAASPGAYEQSSPLFFINSSSPPTLIFQGGRDQVVPPVQSEMLKAKLDTAGVPNQYVLYPTEAHGWEGANLADTFIKVAAFLRAHP
ncbi:MAG: alpha/beta hydrolase [Chitinophagaceae bacterium]|nr:MAG: alpha/beta hydrolase [Chitinophagaceae bacterium]